MAVPPSNQTNSTSGPNSSASVNISDYSYELPAARIAQEPLAKRDHAKLLVYDGSNNESLGQITDSVFSDIASRIPSNAFMVVNNSRVIHARLYFQSETGAHIEILFLEPLSSPSIELAMVAKSGGSASGANGCVWSAYVGNARRWRSDELTTIVDGIKITVRKIGSPGETHQIGVHWSNVDPNSSSAELSFGELLERIGHVPLPPYMKRDDAILDKERYQTVYAKPQGSVAAPTAGLHFTPQVMASLIAKGVRVEHVTLHVGAGTFKPVTSDSIASHVMHHEQIVVSKSFIEELHSAVVAGRTIVCVGTTSVRTIESLYWIGVKLLEKKTKTDADSLGIKQWDAYNLPKEYSVLDCLDALVAHLTVAGETHLRASTQLLIMPGYRFRFVDMLITNFHVPKSTLLLLVAALIGDDWKKVYAHALTNNYRFLSYGDSSLLIPRKSSV